MRRIVRRAEAGRRAWAGGAPQRLASKASSAAHRARAGKAHRERGEHRPDEPHPPGVLGDERRDGLRLGKGEEERAGHASGPEGLHGELYVFEVHVDDGEGSAESGGAEEPEGVEGGPVGGWGRVGMSGGGRERWGSGARAVGAHCFRSSLPKRQMAVLSSKAGVWDGRRAERVGGRVKAGGRRHGIERLLVPYEAGQHVEGESGVAGPGVARRLRVAQAFCTHLPLPP